MKKKLHFNLGKRFQRIFGVCEFNIVEEKKINRENQAFLRKKLLSSNTKQVQSVR